MSAVETFSVYLAGELFDAKHLAGNAELAEQIRVLSQGRFVPVLPQDLPQSAGAARMIRDQDIEALLGCDAAVFQYDGLELDSGTVVEYLLAKFADVPSVLLRTDFRHAGDQLPGADPWNLMTSFFPRTEVVRVDSMALYHAHLHQARAGGQAPEGGAALPGVRAAGAVLRHTAGEVTAALERVLAMPPLLPREHGAAVYEWLALLPGAAAPETVVARMRALYAAKAGKGLL